MRKSVSILLASSLLVAAPAQQAQASVAEKAKFVFHLGVAYYAFNNWVWKPYRNYQFKVGAPNQRLNIAKAGIAMIFAATQVNAAIKMTKTSNDPFLKSLGNALPNFSNAMATVGAKLQKGQFDEAGIQDVNKQATNLLNMAETQGQPIRPVAMPIPGL